MLIVIVGISSPNKNFKMHYRSYELVKYTEKHI